jgi:hypothetical protein
MVGSELDPPIEKTEKITKVVVTIIGCQRPEGRMKRRGRTQTQWGNHSHRSMEQEQPI